MFDRELKVGDHVLNKEGNIGRVIKVNKLTYTVETDGNYTYTIRHNGIEYSSWSKSEWFHCDDVTKKIIENNSEYKQKYNNLEREHRILQNQFETLKDFINKLYKRINNIN